MTQNTATVKSTSPNPAGSFNMRMGNTTYVIGVHFSKESKECGFKGIDSVFLDEMVQWHDFQEDFRQMLGEKSILSLSNAMRRAGLEPEGCLHDASWDAYNSARLMETAYSPNFAADVEKAQEACYQEAPRMQGGLPLDVMKKLAALLQSSQPEPAMAV